MGKGRISVVYSEGSESEYRGKKPPSGPLDSVGSETGDGIATKSVLPAEKGKTDHQKDRIVLL